MKEKENNVQVPKKKKIEFWSSYCWEFGILIFFFSLKHTKTKLMKTMPEKSGYRD